MTLVTTAPIAAPLRRPGIRAVGAVRACVRSIDHAVTAIRAAVAGTPAQGPGTTQNQDRRDDRITRNAHARLFPLSGDMPETRP